MSDEQNEQQFVEVLWEDGSKMKCEIYDVVEFEGKTYALLIPPGEEDEDTEVVIMEYVEEEENNGYFRTIEDEDEFNRLSDFLQSDEDDFFEDEEQ